MNSRSSRSKRKGTDGMLDCGPWTRLRTVIGITAGRGNIIVIRKSGRGEDQQDNAKKSQGDLTGPKDSHSNLDLAVRRTYGGGFMETAKATRNGDYFTNLRMSRSQIYLMLRKRRFDRCRKDRAL